MWFVLMVTSCASLQSGQDDSPTLQEIQAARAILQLELTATEVEQLRGTLQRHQREWKQLRGVSTPNSLAPVTHFSPLLPGMQIRGKGVKPTPIHLPDFPRPANLEDLAFADIATLAGLIRSRKVSCLELTQMYLQRLRRLDRSLHCVVHFTEERALQQARQLDQELQAGRWRGLLHGIPWGAKDLFAVPDYPTTWGAKPYEDQYVNQTATVVERLDRAGAVLIAKLTLGALAYGDRWFGGRTRNPWNPEQGSSGSSAGSAAATAAGGVVFALGTETYGSLVSPSTRCGVTSVRPTFGRVSRYGTMALCWSMDKVGPMCRSVQDAAIVFAVIQGPDGKDATVQEHPFQLSGPASIKHLKVGYLSTALKNSEEYASAVKHLRTLGAQVIEAKLPEFRGEGLGLILAVEAATAFDELTRSDRDDLLVRQDQAAWPNLFRAARFIPAVEFLQAQRQRSLLMEAVHDMFDEIDVLIHPSFGNDLLFMTNYTGHPTIVLPGGFQDNGNPRSICFTGRLFAEASLIAIAQAWQESQNHHTQYPPLPQD